MHYILVLQANGFFLRELPAKDAELGEGAVVLYRGEEGVRGSESVIDASDEATMRGVIPGMLLSQARALLRDGKFLELNAEEFRDAQKHWLDLLVPYSGTIEHLDLHRAAIDLSEHPRPAELASEIVRKVARLYPRLQFGVGRTLWLAELALEFGGGGPLGEGGLLGDGAIHDPRAFLAPLPVRALTPIEPHLRERLQLFGSETIADVQALSPDVLRRQFGKSAGRILNAAHGQISGPVRALYPPHSTSGYVPIEGGTDSLQTLEAVFDRLAVEVGKPLLESDRQTGDVVLHIEYEDRIETRQRGFTKPIGGPSSLRVGMALMTGQELEASIYGIRVLLPNLVRRPQHQMALLGESADLERLAPAVRQLQTAFGERVVLTADRLHLSRRLRFLRELALVTGWR